MSAQRLSVLFPLRKFCSVDNENFQILVWQVCLHFLFDENRLHEIVWDWVFKFIFFQTLWKLSSLSAKKIVWKIWVTIKKTPTPLCVCIFSWSLFALPLCLQPSKKTVRGISDRNFWFLFSFSQKLTHVIWDFGFNWKNVFENSPSLAAKPKFF